MFSYAIYIGYKNDSLESFTGENGVVKKNRWAYRAKSVCGSLFLYKKCKRYLLALYNPI